MRIIATPGPTHEPPYVREALSAETSNPDLDPEFMTKYIDARNMIGEMIGQEAIMLLYGWARQ